jgi:hypothetical protein
MVVLEGRTGNNEDAIFSPKEFDMINTWSVGFPIRFRRDSMGMGIPGQ